MQQAILNRARNDKFILILDIPKAVKDLYSDVLEDFQSVDKLQFTCYGSPVPTVAINPLEVPYGGQTMKVSTNARPSYPPLNLSFVVDNGWKNYWLLFSWLNLFNDQKTGIPSYNYKNKTESVNIPNQNQIPLRDVVTSFSTYGLDEFNNKIIEFSYNSVSPVSLGDINFSHQDPSEITCRASFSFFQLNASLLKNVDKQGYC